MRLNPFEVREVLQEHGLTKSITLIGLNPFEVREVLQEIQIIVNIIVSCLNPFEVREVLQAMALVTNRAVLSLNPFEVREVLQVNYVSPFDFSQEVSIPLKSGRCCKKFDGFPRVKYFRSQSL